MDVLHILKSEFELSSRVKMERKWDKGIVLHKGTGNSDSSFLKKLTVTNLLIEIFKRKKCKVILHQQSSLSYYPLLFVLKIFFKDLEIFYDMHDLHLRCENKGIRGYFRYVIFAVFEYLIFRYSNIKIITVSAGLKKVMIEKFKFKLDSSKIDVVRNLSFDVSAILNHSAGRIIDIKNAKLLYFGQINEFRIPISFLDRLYNLGFILTVYGIFDHAASEAYIHEFESRKASGMLFYKGKFTSDDLEFIQRHDYLVMPFDVQNSLNYKYCVPNKLFQALSRGVGCIYNDSLVEIESISSRMNWGDSILLTIPNFVSKACNKDNERIKLDYNAVNSFLESESRIDKSVYLSNMGFN